MMPEQNRGADRLGGKKLSSRHNSVASGMADAGCVPVVWGSGWGIRGEGGGLRGDAGKDINERGLFFVCVVFFPTHAPPGALDHWKYAGSHSEKNAAGLNIISQTTFNTTFARPSLYKRTPLVEGSNLPQMGILKVCLTNLSFPGATADRIG